MNPKKSSNKDGAVLIIVVVILISFTLLVSALLQLSSYNARETERQVREAQAFWLAEAGVAHCIADLYNEGTGEIAETFVTLSRGTGSYATTESNLGANPPYIVIEGVITVDEESVTNRIRITLNYADPSYKEAISGLNLSGNPWTFILGGTGNPVKSSGLPTIPGPGDTAVGGADLVRGDIYAGENGNIYLYGESQINQAPAPNTYGFSGDANTAGGTITTVDSATISGSKNTSAEVREGPDLLAMDYPNKNDYNLTEIFDSFGITEGRLPFDHPLYNLVRRSGNNYYFEPTGSSSIETLTMGDNKIYYADGDIWFDKNGPLQFNVDGTATIVASGDVHIGDGLRYVDNTAGGDLLALIALGKYDLIGGLLSGGNIFFGDARFGTVYEMDAFMFAANDFYYNFEYNPFGALPPGEPETGFKVFGNFVALHQILIYRDWYGQTDNSKPAVFDTVTSTWKDANTGTELTPEQIEGGTTTETWYYSWDRNHRFPQIRVVVVPPLRHYQMIVSYDERIHDPETQPPGLPAAGSTSPGLFQGILSWAHDD